MSSREPERVPFAVRLFPLRHRITLTVYLTVLLALLVGVGAWTMTHMTRAQVASLSRLIDASTEVRRYRTQIDQMQFASYRFIASNHDSAVDRVTGTYETTRQSLESCIQRRCAGESSLERLEGLLEHLNAFHAAFVEAVAQRRVIRTTREGRFRDLMQEAYDLLPELEPVEDSDDIEAMNQFRAHLREMDAAADALWRNDSASSDLLPELQQARQSLAFMTARGLVSERDEVEAALDQLALLYRQLLQRSRGHQFLVNVVMAGDAHEMQMIAELLEQELSAEISEAQNEVDRRLHAFTLGLIVILLSGCAVVFLLGRAMADSVGRQIRQLSRIFSELASGSEAPIRFKSVHNDEVGELVRAAERFREENVERHALIDRYRALNEELEAKVAQRTQALKSSNQELEHLANTDRLTGACNRRALDTALTAQLDRARRYESRLSLLFFDLDHFKEVNDAHGHAVGDQVLQDFVEELRGLLRDSDILGRWGGEEFIVICPDTGASDVLHLADRIRRRIEKFDFAAAGKVTVSIGVAELRHDDHIQDLIDRADQALYEAKESGRNCCILAS